MEMLDLTLGLTPAAASAPDVNYTPPTLSPRSVPGPLEAAFNTVVFGQIGDSNAFLRSTFCGHPAAQDLMKSKGEFVWNGKVYDTKTKRDKPGRFFVVGPYPEHLAASAGEYGKGLGAADVGTPCVVCIEVDENPDGSLVGLDEQCRRLDELVDLGLPPPNAVCLSGGKSVHAFWAVKGLTWPTRDKLQQRLLALTGADPSVGDRGRKMRLGGVYEGGRKQTILALHNTPTSLADMTMGLDAACRSWGMADDPATVLQGRMKARALRKGSKTTTAIGQPKSKGAKSKGNWLTGTWDPAKVDVTLGDGTRKFASDLPEGKYACHCPYHQDNSPSAVIFVDRRRTTLLCSSCGTMWLPAAPRVFVDTTKADTKKEQKLNKPFMPRLRTLPDGVMTIRSPRGTGKTTAIVAGIRADLAPHPDRRAIVIVHRRALVAKYLHDLTGLGFVGMPATGPIAGDRVVVCLDSLPRVPTLDMSAGGTFDLTSTPLLPWHVAYIDEIEQVIGHLDADSLRKNTPPERVVWSLQTILAASHSVVLADADLGGLTLDVMALLGRPVTGGFVNETKPKRAARFYGHQSGVEARLWADWGSGKRVVVASTTKADATRIAARLQGARPTANVICVTSDTSQDYADLVATPDSWISVNKPDAIIYSPSLGTGVDISIGNYWDSVFVIADVGTFTDVFSILQAAERVRNPKQVERHVWIRDRHIFGVTDLAALRRAYVDTPRNELETAKDWGLLRGELWRTTICKATREVIVLARAHRARAQGQIRTDVIHAMVEAGWLLTWENDEPDVDELRRITKERKAVKETWLQAIVMAVPMDLPTAYATLRSAAPMAERARALRAVLEDKFGIAVDAQLAKDWLYNDLASKVRIFGLWTVRQRCDTELFANAVRWNLTRLGETSAVPPTLANVRKFAVIMDAYGVTPNLGMVNNLKNPILGVTPREQQGHGDTLATGGVKRTRQQMRTNGGVTAVYGIDVASVHRMQRLTARWLERRGVQPTDPVEAAIEALFNAD